MSENKENQENQELQEENQEEIQEQNTIEDNETVPAAPSNPPENTSGEVTKSKNGLTWALGSLLLVAVIVIISMLVMNSDTTKTDASDSGVVATVNGENITTDKLFESAPDDLKSQLIEQAVMEQLINQEAEKENIKITDADINEAVEKQMEDIKSYFPTQEELDMYLMQQGTTLEEFKEDMKATLPFELKIRKLLEPQIDTSDEKIASYFEENKEQIMQSLKVQASHILVESEELAASLMEQIKDGADFAESAAEHSIDPGSKEKGGDLGFFGRGQMVPEFEEAAYNLEIGEVSEIVPSQHGFHIIKLTDKETLTLEDDKEEIKDMLIMSEFNRLGPEWMKKIREASTIEIL